MAKGKLGQFGDTNINFENLVDIDFKVTGDMALQKTKETIGGLNAEIAELNRQLDLYKTKIKETNSKYTLAKFGSAWKTRYGNMLEGYKEEARSLRHQKNINKEMLEPETKRFGRLYQKSVWNTNYATNGGLDFYDRIKKFGLHNVAIATSTGEIGKEFTKAVQNFTDGISNMVSGVQRGFWSAGRKLRTLAASFYAIKNAMQLVDEAMSGTDYLKAQAYRLQRYDKTGRSVDTLMNEHYRAAMGSRTSLEDIMSLSQRILATNVTNGNSSESLRLAQIISKASFLGGSTNEESKAAIRQLTQGLASNQLGGDELRSIRENSIGIVEMLSKGLMKAYKEGLLDDPEFANVTIGDIKKLGKEAKLTAKVVTTAFSVMEDEINEGFKNSPQLFGQNITKLSNMFQKLMYDMSKEGKGVARIANEIQKIVDSLSSPEGYKALKEFGNTIDGFLKAVIDIVNKVKFVLSGVTKFLGTFGITPDKLVQAGVYAWGFNLARNFLFGSTLIKRNGKRDFLSGLAGSGGLLHTLTNGGLFNSDSNVAMGLSSINKLVSSILAGVDKIAMNTGGSVLGDTISKIPILAKIAPLIAKAVPFLAVIAGLLAAFKIADKFTEDRFYKQAEKDIQNKFVFSNLTDEDKEKSLEYRQHLLNEYTTKKGFGARWLESSPGKEALERKVFEYEKQLSDDRYKQEMLRYEKETAENTSAVVDISADFLRNIADMRTRTFRGELLGGSTRQGNNIVLNVDYTGDVADFEDKVVTSLYKFMKGANAIQLTK